MMIDLNFLLALDTVVREGSVARAAARLHRAQSAISYQIRQLEQQLGQDLLDRNAYRVRLTAAGEVLLAEGRRLLQHAHQYSALAQQLAHEWEASLALVVDGILPLQDIWQALRQLADEGAPTRVQVKVEFLGGVQQRFEKEAADLMLVKDFRPGNHLQHEYLTAQTCVLCVAAGHPLAQQAALDLCELQQHTELTVPDSSQQANDLHIFGSERVFYLDGFYAKKEAVLMGLGYGWLPLYLIEQELAAGTLVEINYKAGSRYQFQPALVHQSQRPLGRAGQRLSELLRQKSTH